MPYFSMKCSAMSPIALPAATTCHAWQNTSTGSRLLGDMDRHYASMHLIWTNARSVAEQGPPAESSHTPVYLNLQQRGLQDV